MLEGNTGAQKRDKEARCEVFRPRCEVSKMTENIAFMQDIAVLWMLDTSAYAGNCNSLHKSTVSGHF